MRWTSRSYFPPPQKLMTNSCLSKAECWNNPEHSGGLRLSSSTKLKEWRQTRSLCSRRVIHVQDVAKMTLAALRTEKTENKTLTLAGPKAFTVQEVIALCEDMAGREADVTQVPVWLLKATRGILRRFQWARDASDRLVRPLCVFTSLFSTPITDNLTDLRRINGLWERFFSWAILEFDGHNQVLQSRSCGLTSSLYIQLLFSQWSDRHFNRDVLSRRALFYEIS